MNKKEIIDILTSEIKYNNNQTNKIKDAIGWGILVFVILLFFRPYGLSDSNLLFLFFWCLGYGFSTFILFYINLLLLKNQILKLFKYKWYLHYELLFYFIVFPQICIGNFIFSSLIINEFPFTILAFFEISVYTAILFMLIVAFKIIYIIVVRYDNEIVILNTKLEYFKELKNSKELLSESENSLELFFENDSLKLLRNNVALFTAWGNYIKILVNTDKKPVEIVKKGRLKNIEVQLFNYPEFMQCHRSYILNLKFVKRIIGNAKKSDAVLIFSEIKIPIARRNIKKIKEYLKKEKLY